MAVSSAAAASTGKTTYAGTPTPSALNTVAEAISSIAPLAAVSRSSFTVVGISTLTGSAGARVLSSKDIVSAQDSTVRNAGTPPASSKRIESSACGTGKPNTGAASIPHSATASTMGVTASSGLNCAEEPIATNSTPVSGSLINCDTTAFIVSYLAPARVTSTSLPWPNTMFFSVNTLRECALQPAISTPRRLS